MRKVADEMVADGLRDAGYVYIQIDEGGKVAATPRGIFIPMQSSPT